VRVLGAVALVAGVVAAGGVAALAPHFTSASEVVRLRNALLFDARPAVAAWAPAARPADFLVDAPGSPSAAYVQAVATHRLAAVGGDTFGAAHAIARHLLSGGKRDGGAIQAGLDETLERIVAKGQGYCGDYVDAFLGLAHAAGVFARAWAFSLDGFGGHGHIVVEAWDEAAQRWRMLDLYNNVEPRDAAGRGLSATEFRALLARDAAALQFVPIEPRTPPGYARRDKLVSYYQRGLPQWYLWWGSNVFAVDTHPATRAFDGSLRALEQAGPVLAGVHPRLRVLAEPANAAARASMQRLRVHLLATGAAIALALPAALVWWIARRRARARSGGFGAAHA
jgi:hypothetical protein